MCRNLLFYGGTLNNCVSLKKKKALHTESAFCIKGEKFRGTTFVSHFVTAAAKGNSCLLNADQTGILTLCWSGSQVSFWNTLYSRHDSGFRLWSYLPCVPSETIFQPWMVLSDRSLRHTPLLPSLFAYREYFKAKSAKLQGVSGKFMILFIFAADDTLLFITGNTINGELHRQLNYRASDYEA